QAFLGSDRGHGSRPSGGGAGSGRHADPGAAMGSPPTTRAGVRVLHALPIRDEHPGRRRPRLRRGRRHRFLHPDLPEAPPLSSSPHGLARVDRDGDAGGFHLVTTEGAPHLASPRAKENGPGGCAPGPLLWLVYDYFSSSIAALALSEATVMLPLLQAASASFT